MTEETTARVHVIEHSDDISLDLFAPGLTGLDLQIVRPYLGEPLPTVGEVQNLIVLGGAQNAFDDERSPYLPELRRLLAEVLQQEVPTLGICLGAQLLAVAGGGHVQVNAPAGPEVGVVDVRLRPEAAEDPLLGPVAAAKGKTFSAPALHFDAITELPPGAQWLAASRQYPYQAFRIGSALGLQFHPEVSREMLVSWVRQLGGGEPDLVGQEWDDAAGEIIQVADLLSGAFAEQVRSNADALHAV